VIECDCCDVKGSLRDEGSEFFEGALEDVADCVKA
jgi:hypothetical protein